jgi:hypothetical protein
MTSYKRRPVVYLAGPFRAKTQWGREQNIREAERIGLKVAKMGAVPLIPHTMYRNFQEELPDEVWLEMDLELLSRCDAVLFLPQWSFSEGSTTEFAEAECLQMAMFEYELGRAARFECFKAWIKAWRPSEIKVDARKGLVESKGFLKIEENDEH